MRRTFLILALAPLAIAPFAMTGAASAQTYGPSDSVGPIQITATVPDNICTIGDLSDGDNLFDVGVMIDTTTGLLLSTLSAPPKVLTGTQCGAPSQLTISATQMTAQAFTTTPPDGFSRGVDYTATASGWTTVDASYATGDAANAAATQTRDTGGSGQITISLSDFATAGGPSLRPVADDTYQGAIVVTLAAIS
ncbi:hypothetical protein DMC25_10245 [Caulobacter sp. D4A]|uniref:hypothetical protein n=1 Tax=unclassified Caulobacter TaxID=2648921 RepID=UPI000D72B627|nr:MULTISPECIES: hypothetical protein [unclassified Caulobacter]PXA88956.1 hypothetical protein DMC25_10245 [Caulobacter sp. D4A]PXA94933.1 hypothetical protein DMC18_05160 [Caulobacter sp. D5]